MNAVASLITASSSVIALQSPVQSKLVNPTLRKNLQSIGNLGKTLLRHKHNTNTVKTLAKRLHNLNGLPKINNALSTADIMSSSCKLLKHNPPHAQVKKCNDASCCTQANTAAVKLRAVKSSLVKFNKQVSTHSMTVTAIVNAVASLITASSSVIALQSPVQSKLVNPTLRKNLQSIRDLGKTLLRHKHNTNTVKTLAKRLHNLDGLPKINNALSTADIMSSSCKLLKHNLPPPSPSPPPPPRSITTTSINSIYTS